MSTPHDRQRTTAFRAWLKHVGSIDQAHADTGIKPRSLERFRSGKEPPPARLLDQLSAACAGQGQVDLADQLQRAARPEATDA